MVGPELAEGIEPMAYTCEKQGVRVTPEPGTQVLAQRGRTILQPDVGALLLAPVHADGSSH